MTYYETKSGDTVDYLSWKFYGSRKGAVEAILKANNRIADLGPVLPRGTVIVFPELPAEETKKVIRLWD